MQIDLASGVAWDFARPSKPQQSETELIQSIAQGDKRAMHVLFEHQRLRVYRFALRLVADREAAEDLVSEVFLPSRASCQQIRGTLSGLDLALGDHAQSGSVDIASASAGKIGLPRSRGDSGSCGRSRGRDPEETAERNSCSLPDEAVTRAS